MKIEFYRHNLEEADIQNVVDVLRSIFLTTGPVTARFETLFAQYAQTDRVVALSSCTAALHLSLLASGIGPGDEVLTTPLTFIATATAILHTGAVPVFVDVEADTALLDVSKVEEAVTPRTKAVIPVHLYGSMVDMRGLRMVAGRCGIKIIEDCAQCIEGERDGIRPGQLSEAACYSFYATKNLTCGEGGALATNNSELEKKVRMLRLHGMSKEAADRYTDRYQHWDMLAEGWKYNLSDLQSALLVGQLNRLEAYWQKRDRIWKIYDRAFSEIPELATPEINGKSARHLYTIWVDPQKRDRILHRLQEKEIGVAVNFRAIHTLTYFREKFGLKPDDFPRARKIGDRTISLPLYPNLKDDEIDYIVKTVKKIVQS
ncbi:MAG: DegT/DnrJ/EryC1/StrS family aminotransferase [bacterium]